jgi:hypothetical protein
VPCHIMKAAQQACKTRRRKSANVPADSAFPLTIYKTRLILHVQLV